MPFSKKYRLEKKIRIFYIIHSLNIGGSEKVLIDSVNGLDQNKYEVEILSLSDYNAEKSIFKICPKPEKGKITYIDFEFHQDYSLAGYLKILFRTKNSYKSFEKIDSEIKSFTPEIIHFHTGPRELRLQKFFDHKAVYVFTDHTLRITKNELGTLRAGLLSRIFRKLYSGFNLICVSPQIHKSLLEFSIPDTTKKNVVIPNSVDTEYFKRKSGLDLHDELRAVYVSRIDNNKGHEELIRAWSELNDIPNKQLYLVGSDLLNGKIQKLAVDLKCSDSIVFMGPVSETRKVLETCNLGVFPSHKEGLSLSLLEKMSMNLPLIVSDIPELTLLVDHENTGLVYRVGDSQDLASKIRYMYTHPEEAKSLAERARELVVIDYSADNSRKKLNEFYCSLL